MTRTLPTLFEGLTETPANLVRNLLQRVAFDEGEPLFVQGDAAGRAFFIDVGEVRLDVRLPGGAVSHLTTVGEGRVLGELSLLSDAHRRTATATAAQAVIAQVMHRRDLRAICAEYHPSSPPILGKLFDHVLGSIRRVNGERAELAGAPPAVDRSVHLARRGAAFDPAPFLSALEFTRTFRAREAARLLETGTLYTVPARGAPPSPPNGERAWYVVLRGALSMCVGTDDRTDRLSLVGPGRVAASDAFVAGGHVVSREGATVLELPGAGVDRWRRPGERWMHRALESFVRALMHRLAEDTRSLARERRTQLRRSLSESGSRSHG